MIYELRIYQPMPGKMPALLRRFEKHTLKIWKRTGIRLVGFWTTLIGENNQQLTYMLAWDSMAEREKLSSTFAADAEWTQVATESETMGQSYRISPTNCSGRRPFAGEIGRRARVTTTVAIQERVPVGE